MADLASRLTEWLERRGFEVPAIERKTASMALDACLRVLHRSIPRRPRRVHRSSALTSRVLSEDVRRALTRVESEIENGDDLNHRLTRRYFKAGFDDRLLNDLGVTHLHLGNPARGTDATGRWSMSGGGADLLWAVFRPLEAFLIDVIDHSAFETYDFVEVLYENWKHLLGAPLPGCTDVEPKLSPSERATVRKAGFTTLVEHRGEVFLPGGYMSSGLSHAVRTASDDRMNALVELFRWLFANAGSVAARITESGTSFETPLTFRVGDVDAFIAGRISLVEQGSKTQFWCEREGVRCRVPKVSADLSG